MTNDIAIRELERLRQREIDETPEDDPIMAGQSALAILALDAGAAALRSQGEHAVASVTPETRRSIQDDMNERLQLAVIKATHPDTGVSLDFVSLSLAQAVVSQAIGEMLNQQTRLLDEERRRWYASLERVFGLSRNTLEGFAPEIAVTHLGLSPVSEATAPHEQKEAPSSSSGQEPTR